MWKVHLKIFLHESWKKYMIVIAVIIAQCAGTYSLIKQSGMMTGTGAEIHLMDYIAYFFQGTTPYTITGGEETFNIPPYWSLYMFYFVLLIGRMTGQFSKKYEQQILLRGVTRTRWWLEINLEIWLECIGYLVMTVLAFGVFAVCTGSSLTGTAATALQDYLGIGFIKGNMAGMAVVFFFSFLSLAYIQQVISMAANTIVGIIVSIALLVASVFHNHPLLIGNYLMGIRQEMMCVDGWGVMEQTAVSAGIILIMAVAGYQIIKRKDLF